MVVVGLHVQTGRTVAVMAADRLTGSCLLHQVDGVLFVSASSWWWLVLYIAVAVTIASARKCGVRFDVRGVNVTLSRLSPLPTTTRPIFFSVGVFAACPLSPALKKNNK